MTSVITNSLKANACVGRIGSANGSWEYVVFESEMDVGREESGEERTRLRTTCQSLKSCLHQDNKLPGNMCPVRATCILIHRLVSFVSSNRRATNWQKFCCRYKKHVDGNKLIQMVTTCCRGQHVSWCKRGFRPATVFILSALLCKVPYSLPSDTIAWSFCNIFPVKCQYISFRNLCQYRYLCFACIPPTGKLLVFNTDSFVCI